MDIINSAKKSRTIDRSLEENNKISSVDGQSLITSYVTEEPEVKKFIITDLN